MKSSFSSIVLLSWCLFIKSFAVQITPKSKDRFIDVELTNDARGKNKILNNQWSLDQDWKDPLKDWGLILTLDSEKYGFRRDTTSSKLTIKVNGYCPGNKNEECDAFWAFSFGENDYIAFFNDFDSYLHVNDGPNNKRQIGIFAFPKCGGDVSSGDVSKAIQKIKGKVTFNALRSAVAGGDDANWNKLSSKQNGDHWPVTFILNYNDKSKTLSIKFISKTFPNGISCSYKPKRSLTSQGLDFKLFLSPDGGDETIRIKSFNVIGSNTGIDECELAVDSYLDKCYCDNKPQPIPKAFANQNYAMAGALRRDPGGEAFAKSSHYNYFDEEASYNDMNKFNNPNDNNYKLLMAIVVSNLFLTIIMFNYIICTRKRGGSYFGGDKGKYVSVSVESDMEQHPFKS